MDAPEAPQKKKAFLSVPWPWWLGLLLILFTYYSSQFIAGAILIMYGAISSLNREETVDWLGESMYAQFAFIFITEIIVVAVIYFFVRQYKNGFKSIGIRKPKWSDLGYALMIAPVYFITYLFAVMVISLLFPGFDINQEQKIGFDNVSGNIQLFITFISLVILPPIAEELMARGVIYGSLKKAFPIIWASIFTSLLFAVPHLQGGESGTLLYIAGIDTFILSLYLIYLREKTGGLWSSMTLHGLKNCVAFVALFVLNTQ